LPSIVNRDIGELVPCRVRSRGRDRAALAIAGDNNSPGDGHLTSLLDRQRQDVVVHFCIRPQVLGRIARDGVILAVVRPDPLVVRRLAVGIPSVHRDPDFFALGGDTQGGVVRRAGYTTVLFLCEPRLSLSLPSLSFQVPICQSIAKAVAATRHSTAASRI